MRFFYTSCICPALAVCAGCSNIGPIRLRRVTRNRFTSSHHRSVLRRRFHPDHSRSRMSPGRTKKKDLFYIADEGSGDVYIFSYPKGDSKGTLTGFAEPQRRVRGQKG